MAIIPDIVVGVYRFGRKGGVTPYIVQDARRYGCGDSPRWSRGWL